MGKAQVILHCDESVLHCIYYILTVAKEAIIPHRGVSQEAQRADKKCQEDQSQRRNKYL